MSSDSQLYVPLRIKTNKTKKFNNTAPSTLVPYQDLINNPKVKAQVEQSNDSEVEHSHSIYWVTEEGETPVLHSTSPQWDQYLRNLDAGMINGIPANASWEISQNNPVFQDQFTRWAYQVEANSANQLQQQQEIAHFLINFVQPSLLHTRTMAAQTHWNIQQLTEASNQLFQYKSQLEDRLGQAFDNNAQGQAELAQKFLYNENKLRGIEAYIELQVQNNIDQLHQKTGQYIEWYRTAEDNRINLSNQVQQIHQELRQHMSQTHDFLETEQAAHIENYINQLCTNVTNLKEQTTKDNVRITKIEQDINILKNDDPVIALTPHLNDIAQSQEQVNIDLEATSTKVQQLSLDIKDHSETINALIEDINALSAELESKEVTIQNQGDEINKLHMEVNRLQADVNLILSTLKPRNNYQPSED